MTMEIGKHSVKLNMRKQSDSALLTNRSFSFSPTISILFRYTFEHLDKGRYVFRVRTISLAQTGSYTDYKFIVVYDPGHSTLFIIFTVFLSVVLAIAVATVIVWQFSGVFRKRWRFGRGRHPSIQNILIQMDEYSTGTPPDEEAPSFYHTHDDNNDRVAF